MPHHIKKIWAHRGLSAWGNILLKCQEKSGNKILLKRTEKMVSVAGGGLDPMTHKRFSYNGIL